MTKEEFKNLIDQITDKYNWKLSLVEEASDYVIYNSQLLDVEYSIDDDEGFRIYINSALINGVLQPFTNKHEISVIKSELNDYIRISYLYSKWVDSCRASIETITNEIMNDLDVKMTNRVVIPTIDTLLECYTS